MANIDSLNFKVVVRHIKLKWFLITIAYGLVIKVTTRKKLRDEEIRYT